MKKSIGFIIFIVLLGMFACTRDTDGETHGDIAQNSTKDWFNNTFKKSEEWKQNPESTNKIPDWSKGTYLENDSIEIFECPLQEESVKIFMPPKKSSTNTDVQKIIDAIQLRLVIIRTDSSKMIVRKLYYIPDNQYLLAKGGNIDNVMLNKMGDDFTGLLITKNWNDKVLSCHNINNGKVESVLVKRNINNTTARIVNELDEVIVMNRYSQTRPYDYTGWYVPYNPPSPVSNPNLPYSMPAPGSGGGSLGSWNNTATPPEDVNLCLNGLNHLVESSGPTFVLISSTIISESNTDVTRNYKWKIFSGPGYGLYSSDTGTLKKVANSNPALQKEFVNLTHNSIYKEGFTIGGDVSYSTNYAQPTVGKYNSVMDLNYNVKFSFACKSSPVSTEGNYNSHGTFNVND